MTTPVSSSRTIDNMDLALESSNTYARTHKELESMPIKDGRSVSRQAGVPVLSPSYESELSLTFGLEKVNPRFAEVPPLPVEIESRPDTFTNQMSPRMGSLDQQQAQLDRIEAIESPFYGTATPTWEQQYDIDGVKNEKKAVKTAIDTIQIINRNVYDVRSSMNELHKA